MSEIKTLQIRFKNKTHGCSDLPGLWHGHEIACPAILAGHLQEDAVRAVDGKTKVCETLQRELSHKTETDIPRQTCSWSHGGMAEGLKKPLSLGQTNPSSSMLKGAGVAGSWNVDVGETIIFSANEGGGMVGAWVVIPLRTLRRRLASMMRSVKAYLDVCQLELEVLQ